MIARPLNVAWPPLPVSAVTLTRVAPEGPVATCAVMVTFACATLFPFTSRSRTCGWVVRATPLCAVVDGWRVIARTAAGPETMLNALEAPGLTPLAAAVSV